MFIQPRRQSATLKFIRKAIRKTAPLISARGPTRPSRRSHPAVRHLRRQACFWVRLHLRHQATSNGSISPMVLGAIMEHYNSGATTGSVDANDESEGSYDPADEAVATIKELLETRVRPRLPRRRRHYFPRVPQGCLSHGARAVLSSPPLCGWN
jgi:hypothetical protein